MNEAYQQSRREDPDEVPLEEQITTVNEGRPKRNDIVSQCLPVALVTDDFSRLHYNIIQHVYVVISDSLYFLREIASHPGWMTLQCKRGKITTKMAFAFYIRSSEAVRNANEIKLISVFIIFFNPHYAAPVFQT